MLDLVAFIPTPPFHNLQLGPLTLHGYGLFMGLAVLIAVRMFEWGLQRQHIDTSRITPFVVVTVVAGFIGARLYHVASQPIWFAHHPSEIPKIWHGGIGIYGGILGGVLAGLAIAPRYGIPRRAGLDAIATAFPFAQATGRLGNYLNQELFGKPFDGPWALVVDAAYRPAATASQRTYHPTFLYEFIGNVLVGIVVSWLLARWTTRPRGVLFFLYLALYSFVRLLVESLRIDHANHWLGLRQNVWVAGSVLVVSAVVVLAMVVRARSNGSAGRVDSIADPSYN